MEKLQWQNIWVDKIPNEYKTVEVDETIKDYWKDFQYWWAIQKLRPWVEVLNKPTWWSNIKIWYFTFNATWNITITWVWFKPNLVKFTFCDQVWWMWVWAMTWTYQYAFDFNSKTQIQTQCIYIRNSWWTAIWRAVFVSMNNDWFTIDITLATTIIHVNYECY